MKKIKLLVPVFATMVLLSGCGLIKNIDAGNADKLPAPHVVSYDQGADVSIATKNGIVVEKIKVTEPVKTISVKGDRLPSVQTASWFAFDITGADELSDMYVSDSYGKPLDFGPANDNILFGRIYKLDEGYGVLIPNGYGTSITDEEGNIRLKSGDLNIRVGDAIFSSN